MVCVYSIFIKLVWKQSKAHGNSPCFQFPHFNYCNLIEVNQRHLWHLTSSMILSGKPSGDNVASEKKFIQSCFEIVLEWYHEMILSTFKEKNIMLHLKSLTSKTTRYHLPHTVNICLLHTFWVVDLVLLLL